MPSSGDAASAVVVAAVEGTALTADERAFFETEAPAGVTLFRRNIAPRSDRRLEPNEITHVLRIYIFNEVDQTAIGPGTYTDLPGGAGTKFCGMVWHAFGEAVDGSCSTAPGHWASPATVTLTEVSPTRVVGSFDATIAGDGIDAGARDAGVGHLSGSFSAPICPTIDGGATTCL